MKTKFRLIICLLIMTTCFAKAQDTSDFFRLAYGSGASVNGKGSVDKENMAAAIQFPAENIQLYAHNRITKIRFHLTGGIVNDLKVFITHQLSDPYIYEQTVDKVQEFGWNEITLDTPYEIGEEEIFIGYELNGKGTSLMGIYGDTANTLGDWYRIGEEWQHISDNGWNNVMAIEAIIQGDNLPKTDVDLKKILLTRHAVKNEPISLRGTISNNGVETIKKFDITYEINGNILTNKITGLSIPYESTDSFEDPAFVVSEEGDFDVNITISNINGKEDLNPENNTAEKHIFCKESFEPRNVLVEMFSTENCPSCPEGHRTVDALLENHDRIIRVDHHAAYGYDKYTVPASQEYERFYGVGMGKYAPALMMDRYNMTDFGAMSNQTNVPAPGPVFRLTNLEDILKESLATPAYATIDLKVDTTELPKLKITVSGEAILPISGDSSRVNVYITEDDIFSSTQASSGGKWYHQHTLRENLTSFRGDPINLTEGFEMEYTAEISEEWNKNRLNVVAFVANYDGEDINNCVVYNAAEFSLYDKSLASIEDVLDVAFPKVYISGNKLYIDGEYVQADLFNSKGEKRETFLDQNTVDIHHLDKGLYIVRVLTKDRVKNFKVII